jgi:hypothetical protein
LELEDITGVLLAFHQRKKNIDENSQGEGLVVKGNINMEETVTMVIQKARILGQSPREVRTSTVISAKRKGT